MSIIRSLRRRTIDQVSFFVQKRWAEIWTSRFSKVAFVHINKTGGSSIEKALGIPFQHRTAPEFRDLMGPRRFNRAFRFTFVRNPFEKVLSHYRFRVKTNQTGLGDSPIPFSEWVKRAYAEEDPAYFDQPRMFWPQVDWLRDPGGPVLVEFVGRFENLAGDFSLVSERLGIRADLPHLKKSGNPAPIADSYDDEAREIITEVFSEDLSLFGYSFEE